MEWALRNCTYALLLATSDIEKECLHFHKQVYSAFDVRSLLFTQSTCKEQFRSKSVILPRKRINMTLSYENTLCSRMFFLSVFPVCTGTQLHTSTHKTKLITVLILSIESSFVLTFLRHHTELPVKTVALQAMGLLYGLL